MSKLRHEWLMLMAELAMERLESQSSAVYHCWLRHAKGCGKRDWAREFWLLP